MKKDLNRASHSALLKSAKDIDIVVAKGTNFNDFNSIIIFLEDVIKASNINQHIKSNLTSHRALNIVDMCSGSGVFGIALAKIFGGHGTIHFIDIVGEYHETAKKLTGEILGESYQPITHTCSAEQTTLEDNSIDILIEVNGFHHVPSLPRVIKESKRILKPKGILLGLDRIHENNVSEKQLNTLLDAEYSSTWLKENNYIDRKLTRRENGEGEIRFREWEGALINNGFNFPLLIQYVKRHKRSYKVWLISNLPESISRLFLNYWIKPPRWSLRLLMTMIFGVSLKVPSENSPIYTRKFPRHVRSTHVRMEVIICRF